MNNANIHRRAFTLIELLVVIAILALLVSLLLPSLSKAKEVARRASCAGNFHSWGQALTMYATQNDGTMPRTWGYNLDNVPGSSYAPSIFSESSVRWDTRGDIGIVSMAQYIGGATYLFNDGGPVYALTGPWICPATSSQSAVGKRRLFNYGSGSWLDFSYYAYGESEMSHGAGMTVASPRDLVDSTLGGSDRIWLTDTVAKLPWGWFANHGRTTPAIMFDPTLPYTADGPGTSTCDAAGANETFGDGHVQWMDRGTMQIDNYLSNPASDPRVVINSNGPYAFFY